MERNFGLTKVRGRTSVVLLPPPVSDTDCVGIKVRYSGICGSDFQKYLHHPDIDHWGHEIVGQLCSGRNAYAILKTSHPCGCCPMCLHGREDRCSAWIKSRFNGFSMYVTADRKCVHEIADRVPTPVDVLVEPAYVAMHLAKRVQPAVEDGIAIIGNGTIAILTAFYLRCSGMKNISVFCRDGSTVRGRALEEFGLRCECYEENLARLSDYNKIINTAPYATMDRIIANAAPHSVITFNGISTPGVVSLDLQSWHFKNLDIFPSFPHPQVSFEKAFQFVRQQEAYLSKLITHVIGLQEVPEFLDRMQKKKVDYIKVVIDMEL